MKPFILFIYFLLLSSIANAKVPCVWGEQVTEHCNCDIYKDVMLSAHAGEPAAQYKIWQLMTFNQNIEYRPYIPNDEDKPELSKELLQCMKSIPWKERKILEEEGLYYLKQSAEQGHIDAQFKLGSHLLNSKRKSRDGRLSKRNLIACEIKKQSGNKEPCTHSYHFYGNANTRESVDKLREWVNSKRFENEYSPVIEKLIRNAAEQGHIHAQFTLAYILVHGIGVPIDEVQAQAWRIVAVAQNSPFGANIRDGWLSQRWLTDEEKMDAQSLAEQYMIKYTNLWDEPSVTVIQ